MGKRSTFSDEVRERAVRKVLESTGEHPSQWAATQAIEAKIGCSAEVLRRWVRQAQTDSGKRPGVTTAERTRLAELERENLERERALRGRLSETKGTPDPARGSQRPMGKAKVNGSCLVALLRGINVGGKNIIRMADLRASFEAMGFDAVATYIQSGNVIFSSKPASKARLTVKIEAALSEAFGYASRVFLVSAEELVRVVAQAPAGFGTQPDRYRYDVLFVREPLSARDALEQVPTKPGVDTAHAGDHALYFRRLVAKATESRLSKLVRAPAYKDLTIRNWNTTTKLLDMVSARRPDRSTRGV